MTFGVLMKHIFMGDDFHSRLISCRPLRSAVVPTITVLNMVAQLQSPHLTSAFSSGLLTSRNMDV